MARRELVCGGMTVWASVAAALLAAGHATAQPTNDECGSAATLTLDIPVDADNIEATTSLSLADGVLCRNPDPDFGSGADVFYSFTPDTTGYYDFGTCGSELDTVLSIHSGCPATAANTIACNDAAPLSFCFGDYGQSSYLPGVPLTGGQTYYVRIAGRSYGSYTATGSFTLFVFEGEATPPPANDLCENAEPLTAGTTVDGTTIYATGSAGCGDNDTWDVWYSFTSGAGSPQLFRFTVQPIAFMGRAGTLSIYDDCNSPPVLCQSFFSDFDTVGLPMTVVLNPGQTILLRVAGQQGSQDTFSLQTQNLGTPPTNWQCSTATALTVNTPVQVDTTNAPNDKVGPCGDNRDTNPLWYSFTAPSEGYYFFETSNHSAENPETQTNLVLYSSCGGEPVVCAYDGGDGYFSAATAYHMEANETVKIRASIHTLPGIGIGFVSGGYGLRGVGDQFTLEVQALPDPPAVVNDTCATAKAITLTPYVEYTDSTDITLATDDQDICLSEGEIEAAHAGIWYSFTAPGNGMVRTQSQIPPFYAVRTSLFTGACGSLTQTECPGFSDFRKVTAGTTYKVLINPAPTQSIDFGTMVDVSLTFYPAPANDHCASAEAVAASPSTLQFNNLVADSDPIGPCLNFFNNTLADTVWYKVTTGTAGTLTLHGERDDPNDFSYYPATIVYSGACGSLTEVACGGGDFSSSFDLSTPLNAGQTYLIAFGSRFDAGGPTTVSLSYTGTISGGCAADFNGVNGVTVQDIFDFLTAWLAGNPSADFNHVNGVTVQDIFDFLTAWLAGC